MTAAGFQTTASSYQGPERRQKVVLARCANHAEHQRVLKDHDKAIGGLQGEMADRRKTSSEAHGKIYEEIRVVDRSKVPSKLFYLFVSVYSVLFIAGIVSVYQGMHKNALTFKDGITDVKLMQAELKTAISNTQVQINDLKDEVGDLKSDWRTSARSTGNGIKTR